MKTSILQKWFLGIVLAVIGLSATACNTSRGFGEDVEDLGEEIQDGAD